MRVVLYIFASNYFVHFSTPEQLLTKPQWKFCEMFNIYSSRLFLLILNQRKNLIAKKITMYVVLIIYLNIREFWMNRHKSSTLEVDEERDSNSILNEFSQFYSFWKFSLTQECMLRHSGRTQIELMAGIAKSSYVCFSLGKAKQFPH